MRQTATSWQPDAALGIPVYGCAAVIFPLHLGWTGTPWVGFAVYLGLVVMLFAAVDAVARPRLNKLPVVLQSLLLVLAIGMPAALAFAVGSFAGSLEETMDEKACMSVGATEDDSFAAESNDTFDLTPDCTRRR